MLPSHFAEPETFLYQDTLFSFHAEVAKKEYLIFNLKFVSLFEGLSRNNCSDPQAQVSFAI